MPDPAPSIVLFTDFGLEGPYIGQVKTVLRRDAAAADIVDLFADAPTGNPKVAAYLLAAYADWFPAGTVFFCVVDPGVGGARAPLMIEADAKHFVGPDNGLFELVLRRASQTRVSEISWRPEKISPSFHGRDLFAPAAAMLARGTRPAGNPHAPLRHPAWPDDLAEIVYLDHYGNAMSGLRASTLATDTILSVAAGRRIARAETFSSVPPGAAFWYENSNGLAEIAVNRGRADRSLGLAIGSPIAITS
jgi:S-adenosylmethionine hydrolase